MKNPKTYIISSTEVMDAVGDYIKAKRREIRGSYDLVLQGKLDLTNQTLVDFWVSMTEKEGKDD